MHDITNLTTGVTHQLYARLRAPFARGSAVEVDTAGETDVAVRDRGAVSLEQVLWFVAAGVSVAVIAAILWNTIETEANQTPTRPTAP